MNCINFQHVTVVLHCACFMNHFCCSHFKRQGLYTFWCSKSYYHMLLKFRIHLGIRPCVLKDALHSKPEHGVCTRTLQIPTVMHRDHVCDFICHTCFRRWTLSEWLHFTFYKKKKQPYVSYIMIKAFKTLKVNSINTTTWKRVHNTSYCYYNTYKFSSSIWQSFLKQSWPVISYPYYRISSSLLSQLACLSSN